MRAQRLVGVVHQRDVVDVVQRARAQQAGLAQQPLHLLGAGLGQSDGALLFVLLIILRRKCRD